MRMSISERATAKRPQVRERPKPRYILRAKVGNGWTTIGACWPLRSGEDGFSIKVTSVPLQWDGRAVLLPPLDNEQTPETPEE